MRQLTRFEERQVRALFDVILPSESGALTLGASDVNAAGHLLELLPRLPARTALGLRLVLLLLALSPIWRMGRLSTFARLPPSDGLRILQTMFRSPFYLIRQMVFLVREMACMGYASDPRVRDALDRASRSPTHQWPGQGQGAA